MSATMNTPESASLAQQSVLDTATPPQKRQRISQACTPCRDRKTRCDGRQPICVACENRGVAATCRYDHARRQRARPSLVPDPQQRLGDKLHPVIRPEEPNTGSSQSKGVASVSVLYPRPESHRVESDLNRERHLSPNGLVAARADGLATIASASDESMYGPSSTVAFLRHVMPGASRQGSATPVHHASSNSTDVPEFRNSTAMPGRLPPISEGLAVLPRRQQANNFLMCFWEFIHPLFPVLHKPSFMLKYDKLWVEEGDSHSSEAEAEEAIFTSTLNLVFALGSKFSTQVDASQKPSVADDFYQRSRQSYRFDILDSTSISLVQMLVLTAVYLQSTEHASRCWNSLGLAIRMGQSLGLHVDHAGRKAISQLELEMRRRIWHTCVNLDRLLAMTFGRPSMIGQGTDVPVPALVDDEYLSDRGQGVQPPMVHSRLGLFVSSCQLFDLLEEILALFYRDNSGVSQRPAGGLTEAPQLLAPILDLNRRLDSFVENVPDYLQVTAKSHAADNHIHLQQQVLYCRFLYVRLLSLRPLLLMSTKRSARTTITATSLDDDFIMSCCTLCISTACQLIDTLHSNLNTLYRSSGWHTVYFTFSAAIVLLASSKVDELGHRVTVDMIEASWSRCWAILHHYETQIQSARYASQILQNLKSRASDIARRSTDLNRHSAQNPMMPKHEMNGNSGHGMNYESEMYPPINLDDIDLFSADNMSEAWFGQQLINLDFLERPQV